MQQLRKALIALRSSDGNHTTELSVPGSKERTVSWYSRRLGSTGLLESNGQGHVKVSANAERWLSTGDDRLLAGILHSRLLLFGEILQLLRNHPDLTHSQLRDLANEEYGLEWKTPDPIRKRVGWLRSLGYVNFTFDKKLEITEVGEEVLPLLQITQPEEIAVEVAPAQSSDIQLPEAIELALSDLDDDKLVARKNAFGYIPRSDVKDIYDSIRFLSLIFDPSATKEQFLARCASDFRLKETSGNSALYALRAMGLVEQFSMDGYRLTQVAREWIDSEERWPLLAIVHTHILLISELIPHLNEVTRLPDLRNTVNTIYGTQLSLSEIRSRIHLLVACSAVTQLAPGQFRATPGGLAFADQAPLLAETDIPSEGQEDSDDQDGQSAVATLRQEVTEAAVDSQHSQRFEVAVQRFFEALGYRAEHLGGPGKTDVLVHYSDGPGKTRRFIADAKSSASGSVTDTMVQFPALKDHIAKHKADFAVLVAPSFAGRVTSWAAENNVVLLDLQHVTKLLDNQERNPAPLDLVTAFLSGDSEGWATLESAWQAQQRSTDLLVEVIDCLRREFDNPDGETSGALTAEQIYFLLRDAVEPRPTQAAIKPLLDLLSSPNVQGTKAVGKGWVMPDPPVQIARRLRTLARRIELIGDEDGNS